MQRTDLFNQQIWLLFPCWLSLKSGCLAESCCESFCGSAWRLR